MGGGRGEEGEGEGEGNTDGVRRMVSEEGSERERTQLLPCVHITREERRRKDGEHR